MGEERRQSPRVSVALEARWKGIISGGIAQVSNLSAVGCFLETSGEVLNREVIDVEIMKSDGGWLTLQGQVVYHIPESGLGIFFVEMDEQARREVGELVERYTTD